MNAPWEARLRKRLEGLGAERAAYQSLTRQNRLEIGEALHEVREAEHLTLAAAAALIGISRPTVYCLLEDAEASS